MLDLDGVVYVGGDAVAGRRRSPRRVRGPPGCGWRSSPTTRRAPPEQVAAHLRELGVEARRRRRGHLGPGGGPGAGRAVRSRGRRWCCLGADGLREALLDAGLTPVGVDDDAVAIVTGYGPDVRWRDLMRAAVRIRDGLPWVASNTDAHDPRRPSGSRRGTASRWRCCAGSPSVDPVVAGKPERPLLDETVRRVGGEPAADGGRPAGHRHRGRPPTPGWTRCWC